MTFIQFAKHWTLIVAISLAIFIVYFLVLDKWLLAQPTHFGASYKQFLLENTKEPRIIFDSGSNSVHGINSEMVEAAFGIRTLNLSDHGAYAINFKMNRLEKYLHRGDILIVPLEWETYSKNYFHRLFIDNLYNEIIHYYWTQPFLTRVEAVSEIVLGTTIRRLYNIARSPDIPDHQRNFDRINVWQDAEHYSLRGDFQYSGPLEDANANALCQQRILGFNKIEFSDRMYEALATMKRLQENGVRVALTWPVVVGEHCYDQRPKTWQEQFAKIRSVLDEYKIPYFGDVADSTFGREHYLNTYYHVVPEARDIRTRKLISAMSKFFALPINGSGSSGITMWPQSLLSREKKKAFTQFLQSERSSEFPSGSSQAPIFSQALFGEGWSGSGSRWSLNELSYLWIKLPRNHESDLELNIQGSYFSEQPKTIVEVNGQVIAEIYLDKAQAIVIPKEILQDAEEILEVKLHHSAPKSPFEIGMSPDKRKLSFLINSVYLSAPQ